MHDLILWLTVFETHPITALVKTVAQSYTAVIKQFLWCMLFHVCVQLQGFCWIFFAVHVLFWYSSHRLVSFVVLVNHLVKVSTVLLKYYSTYAIFCQTDAAFLVATISCEFILMLSRIHTLNIYNTEHGLLKVVWRQLDRITVLPRKVFFLYRHWRGILPAPLLGSHWHHRLQCRTPYVITAHRVHPVSSSRPHHYPTVTASIDLLTHRIPMTYHCEKKTTGGGLLQSNYTGCDRKSCMCTEIFCVLYSMLNSFPLQFQWAVHWCICLNRIQRYPQQVPWWRALLR
jgi:hypothetical protein